MPDYIFCDQILLSVYSGRMRRPCGRIFPAFLYTENLRSVLVSI